MTLGTWQTGGTDNGKPPRPIDANMNFQPTDRVCFNCLCWDADGNQRDIPSTGKSHRRCLNPKVGGGSYADPLHADDDAANCYEAFCTGPAFGCVHFQSAADATDEPEKLRRLLDYCARLGPDEFVKLMDSLRRDTD